MKCAEFNKTEGCDTSHR